MRDDILSKLSVGEIMNRWPSVIGVFIDLKLHCVGCPLARFQTLEDAAKDHGIPLGLLTEAIDAAIEGEDSPRAGLETIHHRSEASGADPSPEVSAGLLPPNRPPPKQ